MAMAAVNSANRLAIPSKQRLIVALDYPARHEAWHIVNVLGDEVSFYKVGLQLQFSDGFQLVKQLIGNEKRVFLDSKLYDIDRTVAETVKNIIDLNVDFLTIHGNGSIVRAAMEAKGNAPLRLLSVTVLTSLDVEDLADLGFKCSVHDLVMLRAEKALSAGCDGVIVSGQEASRVRALAGDRLIIVTPGIRMAKDAHFDQKRVTSPYEAIKNGADYIVVGRPITMAADPVEKARQIQMEISRALADRPE